MRFLILIFALSLEACTIDGAYTSDGMYPCRVVITGTEIDINAMDVHCKGGASLTNPIILPIEK